MPLQSGLLNVLPKICPEIPPKGLCVALLILEAAHAFSLLPLRGAFSLEQEGLCCFHLLKLPLCLSIKLFVRVGEKKTLFSWLTVTLLSSVNPSGGNGFQLLIQRIGLEAECQLPVVWGPTKEVG